MLRDRMTVRMVAEHWGCDPTTVHRYIKAGMLSCLRISGVVRITREQVEAFEGVRAAAGERMTVRQVAALWGCDPKTVHRRIADGTLECLRIGRMIRVTKDQVLECEARCTTKPPPETHPQALSAERGFEAALQRARATAYKDAFQSGQEMGGKRMRASLNAPPSPHSARATAYKDAEAAKAATDAEAVLRRVQETGAKEKRALLNTPASDRAAPGSSGKKPFR